MRCSSVTALARTACSVAPRPWRAPVLSNFSASRPLAAAVGRQRRYSEKANSSAIKPRTEIRLEYEGEEAILRALLPPLLSEQEAASLQKQIAREKHKADFKDVHLIEKLFLYHIARSEDDKALIDYYDHKMKAVPTKLMCQMMMLYAAKKRDHLVLKNVFSDMISIPDVQWSKASITVALKGFAQFGDMRNLLVIYEKLYTFGHLPEQVHWESMLKGSARAGDFKHFARFYHRLVLKKHRPTREVVQSLMSEWDANSDWDWKRSKECNTQVYDVVYAVDIALRAHNYKRAIQFLTDMGKLNKAPTIQLYEAFLVAVRRDIPQLHAEVREWKLKFKHFFGPADKEITVEFMEFVQRVRAHIGEAKLDSAPVSPPLLKTKCAVSRKEARILHGFVRPTEPWVGAYTDDSRLFEYVPEYEQRLKAQRDAATQLAQKTKVQTEIDAEIAAAKEKARSWRQLGFEGDFALTEGLQDGLLTKEKKTKEEH